jgi:hypothetical protein
LPGQCPSHCKSLAQAWFQPPSRVLGTHAASGATHRYAASTTLAAGGRLSPRTSPPSGSVQLTRRFLIYAAGGNSCLRFRLAPRDPNVRKDLRLTRLPRTMPPAGAQGACCGGQCACRNREMPLSTY